MGFDLDRALARNDCKGQIVLPLWVGAGWQAVKIEAELGAARRRGSRWFRDGQSPLRRRPFDKQFDRLVRRCKQIDGNQRLWSIADAARDQSHLRGGGGVWPPRFSPLQFRIICRVPPSQAWFGGSFRPDHTFFRKSRF